jgi:carboxymethylenebutenolidase
MRMRRILLACFSVVLVALVSAPVLAQDWAKAKLDKSPRHLEWVTVKSGERSIKTFVAYPEVKGKATTVLLVHEIFGLSDWVRETADQLAAQGYIAVAPDLLSGQGLADKGTAGFLSEDAVRKAVSELPPAQVTSDLTAVLDYAAKLPAGNSKVVVAGFCWGGGQAFRFATNNDKIKAAYVFYGPPPEESAMTSIKAPVLGFYAENDARISATIQKTKEEMAKAKKSYEVVVYKGAGHGFMRAGEAPDAKPADKAARAAAWKRLMASLRKI